MISVARKALPRRRPNRVRLVEPDGSPARPSAESWPAWTDNHFWECGSCPEDLASYVHVEPIEPDGEAGWIQTMIEASLPPARIPGIDPEPETDEEFFARLASEEAAERERILATYQPLPEDLEEYRAYCESLESGAIHPAESGRFEFSPIRSGQVSSDELAQLAAHGCV